MANDLAATGKHNLPPIPSKREKWGRGRGLRWRASYAWAAAALTFIVVLYFLNPTDYVLMPKCPFKLLTGYDCPGCGFQRAMHAFLHGDLVGALRFNPFLVLAVPYLLSLIVSDWLLHGKQAARWQRVTHHPLLLGSYLVLFFVWWVVRNLPFYSSLF